MDFEEIVAALSRANAATWIGDAEAAGRLLAGIAESDSQLARYLIRGGRRGSPTRAARQRSQVREGVSDWAVDYPVRVAVQNEGWMCSVPCVDRIGEFSQHEVRGVPLRRTRPVGLSGERQRLNNWRRLEDPQELPGGFMRMELEGVSVDMGVVLTVDPGGLLVGHTVEGSVDQTRARELLLDLVREVIPDFRWRSAD